LLELKQVIRRGMTKVHRTFGRRQRHMDVGDFSAQYLNGRRQAMIFRLCGVALFPAQFKAYQPAGNGISGQTRQSSLAAFGNLSVVGLATGHGGGETSARRRYAHCKFMIIQPVQ
jgi:hypothetical protein